jgi:predicted HTH transcriptional regulator
MFGTDRFSRFPDSWIQAGRFAGEDRRRILDSAQIRSPLPGAVGEVIAFLQKHMSRGSNRSGQKDGSLDHTL